MPTHLLDANIFIGSHQRHYGMDFCPGFWEWLVQANLAGRVFSIGRVREELLKQEDCLGEWAKIRGPEFFLDYDEMATSRLSEVAAWPASQPRFKQSAIQTFLGCADLYIIAYARSHNCIVVTHETSAPESKKGVKIPDVCIAFGVKYMTLWELLRSEGAKFVVSS